MFRGLAVIANILVAVVIGSGIFSLAGMVADIGVAKERTKQVQVEQVEQTKRTQIEWDAKIIIEEIKADAQKKTSPWFVAFWMARWSTWGVTILVVLIFIYINILILGKAIRG